MVGEIFHFWPAKQALHLSSSLNLQWKEAYLVDIVYIVGIADIVDMVDIVETVDRIDIVYIVDIA